MSARGDGAKAASNDEIKPTSDTDAMDASLSTLTRAHLARSIQGAIGVSRAQAAVFVEQVLAEIIERLIAREEVKLSSFGNFSVREKRARAGRNPRTGEDAAVSARLVVVFRPSSVMRARIETAADDRRPGRRAP